MRNSLIYSYDVIQAALKDNKELYKIKFTKSHNGSPYSELNIPCINRIDFDKKIPINLIVRFAELLIKLEKFDDKFQDDFIDIFIFYNSFFDLNSGRTYQFYIGNLIIKYVKSGKYGQKAEDLFNRYLKYDEDTLREIAILIAESLTMNDGVKVFLEAVYTLFNSAKIYQINNRKRRFIIECNCKNDDLSLLKIDIIKEFFIPIGAKCTFLFRYPMPIIGDVNSTIIDYMSIINSKELN